MSLTTLKTPSFEADEELRDAAYHPACEPVDRCIYSPANVLKRGKCVPAENLQSVPTTVTAVDAINPVATPLSKRAANRKHCVATHAQTLLVVPTKRLTM
jgi:hypothetical protein